MDGQNDRQMFQGDWACSNCNKGITELPFEPRSTENLLCRDCHSQLRQNKPSGGGGNGERKMHSGNWKCSGCGGDITELPFEPRDTSNLMCRDCFKKSKGLS